MSRLRRKLTLANVAATLAVFLAMGGGYALAFSGSGTLQKGSETGFTSSPETVRTITGIGSFQALCVGDPGDPNLRLVNTSGKTLRVFRERIAISIAAQYLPTEVLNNQFSGEGIVGDTIVHYHVYPADGTKRPQADIQATVDDTNDCATTQVSVLALNTEE